MVHRCNKGELLDLPWQGYDQARLPLEYHLALFLE